MPDRVTSPADPPDSSPTDSPEDLEFDCPRCGRQAAGRFYGPCGPCVDRLRADNQAEARDVEAPEYEPKMNVTPNAVATKE